MVEESIHKKLIMEEDEDEIEVPEQEMVPVPVSEHEMVPELEPVPEQEVVPKSEPISESVMVPVKSKVVVEEADEIDEIPFSLGDEVMEAEQEQCSDPTKVNMPQSLGIVYHTSDLVNSLQNCAGSLRTGLAFMGLNDENSKLELNANQYIKISNLISDMKKSLEVFESKISFK